jgi:hypothetical protein
MLRRASCFVAGVRFPDEISCFWGRYECVGRQKGLCGSCLIRVTSMHYIKSIRMFEGDVTSPEQALVIQGGCLGVWWIDVCNWKNVCLLWALPPFFLAR